MDYSDKIALNFIHMAQKLGHAYIAWRGFTMSVADMIPNKEYTKQCNQQMADAFQRASISDAVAVLNGARDSMSLVAETCIPADNNFRICINSGVRLFVFIFLFASLFNISLFFRWIQSKGSSLNLTSLMACLGQQSLKGKRMSTRSWHGRCLPHFKTDDDSPTSLGFVKSSFLKGLSPSETFFHFASG
jgi:hypothetical protein